MPWRPSPLPSPGLGRGCGAPARWRVRVGAADRQEPGWSPMPHGKPWPCLMESLSLCSAAPAFPHAGGSSPAAPAGLAAAARGHSHQAEERSAWPEHLPAALSLYCTRRSHRGNLAGPSPAEWPLGKASPLPPIVSGPAVSKCLKIAGGQRLFQHLCRGIDVGSCGQRGGWRDVPCGGKTADSRAGAPVPRSSLCPVLPSTVHLPPSCPCSPLSPGLHPCPGRPPVPHCCGVDGCMHEKGSKTWDATGWHPGSPIFGGFACTDLPQSQAGTPAASLGDQQLVLA